MSKPSKPWWHKRDPEFDAEKARYQSPIPSRLFIREQLTELGQPNNLAALIDHFKMRDDDAKEGLRRRLIAMCKDGQLHQTRRSEFAPIESLDLIRGRVIGQRDGYGFLVPDDASDDLYLSAREMKQLFHGDIALAHVRGVDKRGRREGAVVQVLERNTKAVVGRFQPEGEVGFVVPDNARLIHDIVIPAPEIHGAKAGQIVVAEITEHPRKRVPPIGRISQILGEHGAPGMETQIALHAHGIPFEWPNAALKQAKQIGEVVPEAAKQGREDLRATPLVTIDGADARDFDDAVFAEPVGKGSSAGWRVLVAIADVSTYVEKDSPLDEEARNRGNSVYLPDRVVPMLPESLSNGLCSLNPEVDRLCLVCEMRINQAGKVTRSRFFEGVMNSHARLTYDKVARMLLHDDEDLRERYAGVFPHLQNLHAVYGALHTARQQRGAIEFDTQETKIVFGADQKILRIEPTARNDAHMLIEECMIAANVEAARFLIRHKLPALYRVHEGPKAEKLEDLHVFLSEFGLKIRGGSDPQPMDYLEIVEQIKGRPDAHLIQTVLLRSLSQAVYSPDKLTGHFGLALRQYGHFTSPIRRYPDLLVHRGIKHIIHQEKPGAFAYSLADMERWGEHCSMTERRADEAVRSATDWLKCEFMEDKVGEEYAGIVTAVTRFGLFVELADIFVEGLVHISALQGDFYHHDPVAHSLTGERFNQVYRLGDALKIRVTRVDLDERKIDFELCDSPKVKGKDSPKSAAKGARKTSSKESTKSAPKGVKKPARKKRNNRRKP